MRTVTWRDDLPREVWEEGFSTVLADRIAEAIGPDVIELDEIVERLNVDVDEGEQKVKKDSVRKALARGIPDRFTLSGGRYGMAER